MENSRSKNVLSLCDGGAIEFRQPNPCTKAKLNLGLRTSAPLLQNPCCADALFIQEVLLSLLDVK